MSTVKTNNVQIGQSVTATNNFTWYQPSTPDGTVRLGIGNAGATSGDVLIASSTGISTPSLVVSGSTAPTNGMFLPTTNTLAWSTNSTERLRLDASGNLGLGVTPSGWTSTNKAIQVGAGGALIGRTDTVSAVNLGANYYYNGTNNIYIGSNYASIYAQSNGQHQFFTAPSGTAGNAISFTQAMTLDASGNLMVGTTSQSGLFTVNQPAANGNTGSFVATNTSGPNYVLSLQSYASATNTAAFIRAYNNTSTLCFNVAGNGNVTNTNSSYGAISDRSLKENIVDATPKLVDLLKVKIRNFNLIGDSIKQIGVVAQELEEVFPAMVEEDKDGIKSVKYSVFTPMLVKAIQELSAELNELKTKVNA